MTLTIYHRSALGNMAPWLQESAAAADKYYIGDGILKPSAHHESFQKLWETKWKVPVRIGLPMPKSQIGVLTYI